MSIKNFFKVSFLDENNKVLTLIADEITSSSMLGFIELSGLSFPEPSNIIITPNNDKIKNLFKDSERVYIPISRIVHMEEIHPDKKATVLSLVNTEKLTDK